MLVILFWSVWVCRSGWLSEPMFFHLFCLHLHPECIQPYSVYTSRAGTTETYKYIKLRNLKFLCYFAHVNVKPYALEVYTANGALVHLENFV